MVRVICFDLSTLDEENWQNMLKCASPERKHRAQQCRKEETAKQCILSEVLLHYGLSRQYGDVPNCTVCRTEAGKPMISELPDFQFNLSHCGRWVAFAWSDRPVGIDVQISKNEKPALVRRHFTQREQAYVFDGQDTAERAGRFCKIWTAKESWLKCLGTGLTADLRSFDTLDGSLPVHFHWSELPGGYTLCSCGSYQEVFLEQIELSDLSDVCFPDLERRA